MTFDVSHLLVAILSMPCRLIRVKFLLADSARDRRNHGNALCLKLLTPVRNLLFEAVLDYDRAFSGICEGVKNLTNANHGRFLLVGRGMRTLVLALCRSRSHLLSTVLPFGLNHG